MENKFFKDKQGNICYKGSKYEYSFLVGYTNKGFSSDVLFIYREPIVDKEIPGDVVNFIYGGFNNLKDIKTIDYIVECIAEYEKNN